MSVTVLSLLGNNMSTINIWREYGFSMHHFHIYGFCAITSFTCWWAFCTCYWSPPLIFHKLCKYLIENLHHSLNGKEDISPKKIYIYIYEFKFFNYILRLILWFIWYKLDLEFYLFNVINSIFFKNYSTQIKFFITQKTFSPFIYGFIWYMNFVFSLVDGHFVFIMESPHISQVIQISHWKLFNYILILKF